MRYEYKVKRHEREGIVFFEVWFYRVEWWKVTSLGPIGTAERHTFDTREEAEQHGINTRATLYTTDI